MPTQKIKTFLWYDTQAEEAARFYVSLFPDSRINRLVPGPGGTTMLVDFTLAGVDYAALNGGPMYQFSEAISLAVDCDDQAEIDWLWNALSDGGSDQQCGWLKDRYGLSWQIVPAILPKLLFDPARGGAVMQALMQMKKLDIQKLQAAYDGR